MLGTLLAMGLGGVFALLGKSVASDLSAKRTEGNTGALTYMPDRLVKGQRYAILMMVDPTAATFGGQRSLDVASDIITSTLAGANEAGGFAVDVPALPIDDASATAFTSGRPAEWVMTGVWKRDAPNITFRPDWLQMARPLPVPG